MREGNYRFGFTNPLTLPNVGGALGLVLGVKVGDLVGIAVGVVEGFVVGAVDVKAKGG